MTQVTNFMKFVFLIIIRGRIRHLVYECFLVKFLPYD